MDVKRRGRIITPDELDWEERHVGDFVDEMDLDGGSAYAPAAPGTVNALGAFLREQPPVIFGNTITVGAAAPPAGVGAFYDPARLLRVDLPPELAGVWTLTLSNPGFVGYTIFGAGTLIDPGPPNMLDSFLRIRWGMGAGVQTMEADLLLGQQINLAGRYFEVDLVARDPQIGGVRIPYRMGAALAPAMGSSRGLVRRTVNVGNILFGTSSNQFPIPRFATEWMGHWGGVANGANAVNVARGILFFSDNGATEVARFDFTSVASRTTWDGSTSWLPVPIRAQTFRWDNNGAAGTMSNASLTFRLAV